MSFFLKCNLMRHSSKRIQWLVHVDTTQLYLNHEIMLSRVQLPDAGNSGETLYELKPLKQPRDMEVVLVKKRRWKGQKICIRAPSSARGSSSPLNLCAVSVVWSEKQYLSLIISHLLGWVEGCYSIQQYYIHNWEHSHPQSHDPSDLRQGSRALAGPDFLSMRRVFVSYSQPIRFARFDGKSVNRGLPVLDKVRALDPCRRSEGSWLWGREWTGRRKALCK